jgi:hypothetical protein
LFVRIHPYCVDMNTLQRGDATEAALITALVDHGFEVLLPFSRSAPYDLGVVLAGNRFVRIQCKCGRVRAGCVVFNTSGTDHGSGARDYRGRADLFGVRCGEIGSIFLVPVATAPLSSMGLRLTPAKNKQRSGIRFAADYEIGQWTLERFRDVIQGSPTSSAHPE